uniref:L1 transposable element RRM domain-containing protein n=1 Tax=Latimeria chalumnae TaxID=7897 RepID=H3AX75_LATCH
FKNSAKSGFQNENPYLTEHPRYREDPKTAILMKRNERKTSVATLETLAADLRNIFTVLQQVSTDLLEMKTTAAGLKNIADALGTRMTEVEQRVSDIEDEARGKTECIAELETKLSAMAEKMDDLENRSRRNNIRIVGFPEGVEKGNPAAFLASVLPSILQLPPDTHLNIERAHRSIGPRPGPDQRPRAFVVKLLQFPTRDRLLRAAREKNRLEWNGNRISLFPDLSKELQGRRQRFNPVRRLLQEKGPATMKVTFNGKTSAFADPVEALEFAESLPPCGS